MELTTREAVKLMVKLEVQFVTCKHHIRGFVVVNGKRLFPIHCSNGHKAMPGHIPELFRKSLKLDRDEFAELRRCTLGRDRYVQLLEERGLI